MKRFFYTFLILFNLANLQAQNVYHVKPSGSPDGNGTIKSPWDLQSALSMVDVLKGGDILYLHKGIYKGRFTSEIAGTYIKPITVKPYKGAKVILDGNNGGKENSVLIVKGGFVEFHSLEITFRGSFSRSQGEDGFKIVNGISHISGEDCKFIDLKVHNNPGTGIGSWKYTGGSQIVGCRIFNNGYFSNVRGSGVGIYVQNISDKERLIKNNFVFNNYYKGIQVWSASSGSNLTYIKNTTLENNVIFNNGLPAKRHVDNVIVASGDADGVNVPRNIKLLNNVLYHNTEFSDKTNFGDGASLTLGYGAKSPVVGTEVSGNVIVGKNNGLRILHAEELTFKDNTVYSGYNVMYKSVLKHLSPEKWKFSNNKFHSRRSVTFRIEKHRDYKIGQWKTEFGIDAGTWKQLKDFDLPEVIHKSKASSKDPVYHLALFEKENSTVLVNFTREEIQGSNSFTIRDIETDEIIKSGVLDETNSVQFEMDERNLTNKYFNVYAVEFTSSRKPQRGLFRKLFGWLF